MNVQYTIDNIKYSVPYQGTIDINMLLSKFHIITFEMFTMFIILRQTEIEVAISGESEGHSFTIDETDEETCIIKLFFGNTHYVSVKFNI